MPVECTYASSATANGKVFVSADEHWALHKLPPRSTIMLRIPGVRVVRCRRPLLPLMVPIGIPSFISSADLIDATGGAVSLVQIYNAFTDTWSSGTALPGPAVYASRAGIVNNKIVVAGGYNPVTGQATASTFVGEINVTDPLQVNWTQADDHPAGHVVARWFGHLPDPASGLVVFAGGSPEPSIFTTTDRTFAFDVNSGSRKLGPDKPTARNLFYMTPILYQDSVYLGSAWRQPSGTSLNHSDAHEWLNLGRYSLATGMVTMERIAGVSVFPIRFRTGLKLSWSCPSHGLVRSP